MQIARCKKDLDLDYILVLYFDSFMELHGDRNFEDDPAMIGGIGLKWSCTVIGQQRGKDTKDNIYRNFGMAHPKVIEKHYV